MQILWFCFLHWLVRSLMRCHASFSYCNSECLSDKERPQGITVVFDVDISVPLFTQQYASSGTQFGFQKHRCRRCGYNKRQTLGLQIEVKCQTLGLQIEVKCVSTKQFQKKVLIRKFWWGCNRHVCRRAQLLLYLGEARCLGSNDLLIILGKK